MYRFSIITAFRNRDLERVRNSLDSLASQINQNFELIFVDYGSDEEVRTTVRPIVESYPFVTYIYNETRGMFWNRSHALNTGIRRAKGEITVLWDIDLMVEPAFLQKLEEQIDYRNTFTTHRCYYLPEDATQENYKQESLLGRSQHAYVGLCTVATDVLQQIEGFDEFFQVWGVEDEDLYKRLAEKDLQRIMINADETAVYHQWHPTQAPILPDLWFIKMLEKFYTPIEDKERGFGNVYQKEDRLALIAYQKKVFSNFKEVELNLRNKTLIYNALIMAFHDIGNEESFYLSFKFPQLDFSIKSRKVIRHVNNLMIKNGINLRLINHREQERVKLRENITSFLKYCIGTYRQSFRDYYLQWSEAGFILIVVK